MAPLRSCTQAGRHVLQTRARMRPLPWPPAQDTYARIARPGHVPSRSATRPQPACTRSLPAPFLTGMVCTRAPLPPGRLVPRVRPSLPAGAQGPCAQEVEEAAGGGPGDVLRAAPAAGAARGRGGGRPGAVGIRSNWGQSCVCNTGVTCRAIVQPGPKCKGAQRCAARRLGSPFGAGGAPLRAGMVLRSRKSRQACGHVIVSYASAWHYMWVGSRPTSEVTSLARMCGCADGCHSTVRCRLYSVLRLCARDC